MGSCFIKQHIQSNESHLLRDNDANISNQQQHIYQTQNNLTDSDQHEYNYREFHPETSITNNSNLNPIYPSNHSSPQHHHHQNNKNININLLKLNNDLQRQIDVLKQCSNDEIKTLKQRIQFLENQFHGLSLLQNNATHSITDDCKQSIECSKNTPIKLCPNTLRIIQISKIFNDMLTSSEV